MKVFRIDENVKLPERKSERAAAFDLYVPEAVVIEGNTTTKIPCGIKVEIPRGYFGMLKERSSMAVRGLHATAGVIDNDYRGEITLLMRNTTSEDFDVKAGDRVAQLILIPQYKKAVEEVDDLLGLSGTDRGDGGFGSTGQ